MNTLGLKITRISAGVQELLTINDGDWTRYVVDVRNYMKYLSNFVSDNGFFVMLLSNADKGQLITLCRNIAGRASDMLTAWIYVPNNISIPVSEELEVIEFVKTELSKSSITDRGPFEKMFAKEYEIKSLYSPTTVSPTNGSPAVRYYGNGTPYQLVELLGDRLNQPYYQDHPFVFFIDKSTGLIANDQITNYTNEALRELIPITPPQCPPGIVVKVNGQPFNQPMLKAKGEKMNLVFERAGFENLTASVEVGQKSLKMPDSFPWKKRITPMNFKVVDRYNNIITDNCTFYLNDRRLGMEGISLLESEIKQVEIKVTCADFKSYKNTFNLSATSFPIHIDMIQEEMKVVYLLDGMRTSDYCPIGYMITEEERRGRYLYQHCYPTSTRGNKHPIFGKAWFLAIGSAIILFLGIAIGLLIHKYVFSTNEQPNEHGKPEPKSTTHATYSCLSGNLWLKDSLDSEKNLEGFYDDLANLDRKELLETWVDKVDTAANKRWGEFVKALRTSDADVSWEESQIDITEYIKLLEEKPKSELKEKLNDKTTSSNNDSKNATNESDKGRNENRNGAGNENL